MRDEPLDFDAAIFDLDGTLLDSMDVWEEIDLRFLERRGLTAPAHYVAEICARSFEEAAADYCYSSRYSRNIKYVRCQLPPINSQSTEVCDIVSEGLPGNNSKLQQPFAFYSGHL